MSCLLADSKTISFQIIDSNGNVLEEENPSVLVHFRRSDKIIKTFSTYQYDIDFPPEENETRYPLRIRDFSIIPTVEEEFTIGIISLSQDDVTNLKRGGYYLEAKWKQSDAFYSDGERIRVQKSRQALRRY